MALFGKKLATVEIPVSGMGCGACVKKIEGALAQMKGIESATVSLENGVTMTYDAKKVKIEDVKARINQLGFEC